MDLNNNFQEDFLQIVEKVFVNKENIVFSRYNEGEHRLLAGIDFVGAGGLWRVYKDSKLQKDLLKTLDVVDGRFIYGIASKQYPIANQWYKENIPGTKSFATIFVNANYRHFRKIITNIREDVVLVANNAGEGKEYPFNVKKFYGVPFDCVKYYEHNEKEVNKLVNKIARYKNRLILFCAGPLSNLLIHRCWLKNSNNRYIDVGSTLDIYIHGEITRQYFSSNSKTYNSIDLF